jgi:hypothetical protein
MAQHMTGAVPLEPVPAALRPLVEAGMAKDPARRPVDGTALVAGLRTVARQACGPGWEERGRSRLAEAALLLAALWPAGGPAAAQGSTVHRVRLRRRLPHRQISMAKAAIMTGIVIAGAAAGTAVAATVSRPSSAPAAATPAAAPRLPVVDDALGWNQHLTRPSSLGALYSLVPPKAIDGNFVLENLRWPAWGPDSAHGTGQIGWAQPGPGGNGISRQAPVTVTLSAVATHGGSRYFSRLAFRFTWRGHTYAGTESFADPCGNTAGCWVAPGMPVV